MPGASPIERTANYAFATSWRCRWRVKASATRVNDIFDRRTYKSDRRRLPIESELL
jgi:hypothetical protein